MVFVMRPILVRLEITPAPANTTRSLPDCCLQSRYLFRNVVFDQRRVIPLHFLESVRQNDLWNLPHLAGEATGRGGPVRDHALIGRASVDHGVDRVEHIVNVLFHLLVHHEPVELRIRSFNESVKRDEDMSE